MCSSNNNVTTSLWSVIELGLSLRFLSDENSFCSDFLSKATLDHRGSPYVGRLDLLHRKKLRLTTDLRDGVAYDISLFFDYHNLNTS